MVCCAWVISTGFTHAKSIPYFCCILCANFLPISGRFTIIFVFTGSNFFSDFLTKKYKSGVSLAKHVIAITFSCEQDNYYNFQCVLRCDLMID